MSGDTAATLGAGIVGGIAGFVLTGGNPLGAQAGFALFSGLTASLVADDITTQGPRLSDLSPRVSEYGAPIPIPYGTIRLPGMMDWMEGNQLREVISEEEVGGKGGPSQSVETASYFLTAGWTICEGPIAGVRRIWLDTVLVYDATETATAESIAASVPLFPGETDPPAFSPAGVPEGGLGRVTLYRGTDSALPNGREEADRGVNAAPAYRGRARLIWEDLPLERWGNRIPSLSVEVVAAGTSGGVQQLATWALADRVPVLGGSSLQSAPDIALDDGVIALTTPARELSRSVNQTLLTSGVTTQERNAQTVYATPHWRPEVYEFTPSGVHVGSGRTTYDLPGHTFAASWIVGRLGGDRVTYDRTNSPASSLNDTGQNINLSTLRVGQTLLYGDREVESFAVADDGTRLFVWHTSHDVGATDHELDVWGPGPELLVTIVSPMLFPGRPHQPGSNGGVMLVVAQTELWVWDRDGNLLRYAISEDYEFSLIQSLSAGTVMRASVVAARGGLVVAAGFEAVRTYRSGVIAAQAQPLSDVVRDVLTRAGLALADSDLTALTGDVPGYALTRPMSARAALVPLRAAYAWDSVEVDYILRAVPRGGAPAATLTADDLGAHEPGQDVPPALTETQADLADLPQRLAVGYLDPATDYEPAAQYASLASRPAGRERRVELALAMSADQAAQAADVLLREAWVAARVWGGSGSPSVALSLRHAALMPADLVTLAADGVSASARITRVDDGRPGIRRLQLVADGPTTYQSSATGQAGEASPSPVTLAGPTRLALMQLPALRDQDAAAGHYAAAGALLSGWQGAALYRSTDAGESYLRLTGWATSALLGTAATALPAPKSGAGVWDRGSVLHVRIPDAQGAPVSVTEAAILADATAGLWAVAAGDDWELIQVANWAQQVDGSWHGTTLLRGRYATEHAMAKHAESDQVVRLSTAGGVVRVTSNLADVGRQVLLRAVTLGSRIERGTDKALTPRAEALRPWTPAHLQAPATPAGDLAVSWVRRARLGGIGKLVGPVAQVETTESYRLEVIRAGTVLRTETVGSSSFTYTAAQQSADGVSTGETLDIDVTQVGDAVDGRTARVSVTAP